MNRRIVFIALWLSASQHVLAADAKTLEFNVFDADKGSEIQGARIALDDQSLTPHQKYTVQKDADSQIEMKAFVEAGDDYYSRSTTIFLGGLDPKDSSRVVYNIYLARRTQNQEYSRGDVFFAAQFIGKDDKNDRAVALLDRIGRESEGAQSGEITQYWVLLNYNLASAYYNSCTIRFVDDCALAQERFALLKSHYAAYSALFTAEKIEEIGLDPPIDLFYSEMAFRRMVWDIARSKSDDAEQALGVLEDAISRDGNLLTKLRVSAEDFATFKQRVDAMQNSAS